MQCISIFFYYIYERVYETVFIRYGVCLFPFINIELEEMDTDEKKN